MTSFIAFCAGCACVLLMWIACSRDKKYEFTHKFDEEDYAKVGYNHPEYAHEFQKELDIVTRQRLIENAFKHKN